MMHVALANQQFTYVIASHWHMAAEVDADYAEKWAV